MQKFLGLQLFLLDFLRLWGLFAPLLTTAIWGQHAAEEFCLLLVIELQEKVNQICFFYQTFYRNQKFSRDCKPWKAFEACIVVSENVLLTRVGAHVLRSSKVRKPASGDDVPRRAFHRQTEALDEALPTKRLPVEA